jgi:hypothetical protein
MSDSDSDDELLNLVGVGTSRALGADATGAGAGSSSGSRGSAEDADPLLKLSAGELKQRCKAEGFAESGTKQVLVKRLRGPPLPGLLKQRKLAGEYVPRPDGANCALLVALHLYEDRDRTANAAAGAGGGGGAPASRATLPMLSKADLMHRAEATGISRDPMETPRGGGGPFVYDGWASVKAKLTDPDPSAGLGPPLVKRFGRDSFKLTTLPLGNAGRDVAAALHARCHALGRCQCGQDASATVGLRDLHDSAFLAPLAPAEAPQRDAPSALAATSASSLAPSLSSCLSSAALSASSALASNPSLAPNPSPASPTAGPAVPPAAKAARKCGKCGAAGHNARNSNCPVFASATDEAARWEATRPAGGANANASAATTATTATTGAAVSPGIAGAAPSTSPSISTVRVASGSGRDYAMDPWRNPLVAASAATAAAPLPAEALGTAVAAKIAMRAAADASAAARVAYLEARRREIELELEASARRAARKASAAASRLPPPAVAAAAPLPAPRVLGSSGNERAPSPEVIDID